jgi:Ca2+-transporting ATPase
LIIFIVAMNVTLGFFQEFKADRALFALAKLLPRTAVVRRDGSIMTISASEVVPGDVMYLTSGDRIVADARIISASNFMTNEAPLTGESEPTEKSVEPTKLDAPISEQYSMVFAGTVAVAGKAQVIVTSVGEDTAFGKITSLVKTTGEPETPLMKQLGKFSRQMTLVVALVALVIFGLGLYRGMPVVAMLALASSLAVAAVPEGLTVALTVIFVNGMHRMAKRGALIRRMVATETLGSVTVMCMDKTGTLTTGEMKVEMFDGDNAGLQTLATLLKRDDGRASPIEHSVKKFLEAKGVKLDVEGTDIIEDLPFDSRRKFSAIVSRNSAGDTLSAWGAPDILFRRLDVSDKQLAELRASHERLMSQGLRVLMIAERPWSGKKLDDTHVRNLVPVGFIGLRDPLRAEAKDVVADALKAGVRTIMITGDHEDTATHIAEQLGLSVIEGAVISHDELAQMSDEQLYERVRDVSVFARVLPEDKVRIVRALQKIGHVVAMTGDGVNDAPALKSADIGVAMGSGTDAAKESADMVLLNDNVATLVVAMKEGRVLYDNIRKVVVFLLTFSLSEVAIIASALIFKLPVPFLPAHILFMNVITDGFPAMALAFEPAERGIMHAGARKKDEAVISHKLVIFMAVVGSLSVITLVATEFILTQNGSSAETARTFLFLSLCLDAILAAFVIRHLRGHAFTGRADRNPLFLIAILASIVCVILPVAVPVLRQVFQFSVLSVAELGVLVGLALIKFGLFEGTKHLVIPESRGIM